MVQGLRLHTHNAGGLDSISGQETRSHVLCGVAKKKKESQEEDMEAWELGRMGRMLYK